MFKSKKTKIWSLVLIICVIVVLILNSVVSTIIENKITALISNNSSDYYTVSIGKPQFKWLQQSLVIDDIEVKSKIEINDSLKKDVPRIADVKLASIKLQGFGLLKLIWNAEIDIYNLEINDLHIINTNEQNHKKKESKPFDINAITIKKINGFGIEQLIVNNFMYEVIDVETNETNFITEPISFKTDGFKLEKYQDDLFKLLPIESSFSISDINFEVKNTHYSFSLSDFNIDFNESTITLNQLQFKPLMAKEKLAKLYLFCDDVYNIELEALKIYNFQLNKFLKKEGVFIDSISVTDVSLELYKDKRKPFNTSKYIHLPHISLQQSKTPLHIKKVNVFKSHFTIEEQIKQKDTLMAVIFADTSLKIENITSIDSLRQKPMIVDIKANLMKKATMDVHAEFSLINDTFNFTGKLGSAKLSLFDSALFPALGLKVLEGDLKDLSFTAYGNNVKSHGQMILLYDNLEADVFKSDSFKTNKFLSWTVNTIVKKSNPTKNKLPRVAVMAFERDTYKGMGNYMWKTILNGITNTLTPLGKHVKSNKKNKKSTN